MSDAAKSLDGILNQRRAMNKLLRDRRETDDTLEPGPLRFRAPPVDEEDEELRDLGTDKKQAR